MSRASCQGSLGIQYTHRIIGIGVPKGRFEQRTTSHMTPCSSRPVYFLVSARITTSSAGVRLPLNRSALSIRFAINLHPSLPLSSIKV